MKKVIKNIRILTITLWPIIFLLGIGTIEQKIRILVSQSYNSKYNILLAIFYIFSGCIFAFNTFCGKECIREKNMVRAYIVSGVLVTIFFMLWILSLIGLSFISKVILNMFVFVPISICSLVFGYTVYSVITVLRCKK